eukprot:7275135-Prymnesium_polylepis.1
MGVLRGHAPQLDLGERHANNILVGGRVGHVLEDILVIADELARRLLTCGHGVGDRRAVSLHATWRSVKEHLQRSPATDVT